MLPAGFAELDKHCSGASEDVGCNEGSSEGNSSAGLGEDADVHLLDAPLGRRQINVECGVRALHCEPVEQLEAWRCTRRQVLKIVTS